MSATTNSCLYSYSCPSIQVMTEVATARGSRGRNESRMGHWVLDMLQKCSLIRRMNAFVQAHDSPNHV